MNHLQQAKHSIDRAATAQSHEHATLAVQSAIGHALIALVERIDKMIEREQPLLDRALLDD